jgi:Tfp pilus assembly protein PilO
MSDWLRPIVAPIVVAVLVGLASSYFSTQIGLAEVREKLARHETELTQLRSTATVVARLEERVASMQQQLDRIERAVDGRK